MTNAKKRDKILNCIIIAISVRREVDDYDIAKVFYIILLPKVALGFVTGRDGLLL